MFSFQVKRGLWLLDRDERISVKLFINVPIDDTRLLRWQIFRTANAMSLSPSLSLSLSFSVTS